MSRRRAAALLTLIVGVLLETAAGGPTAAATTAAADTPTWRPMQVVSREVNHALLAAPTDGSVRGVASVGSGPTSHIAVLHRGRGGGWTSRGLPVIGAVKRRPNPRSEGDWGYSVHQARTHGTSTVVAGGPEVRAAQPRLVFRGRYQVLLKLDRPKHIELWVAGLPDGVLRRTPNRIASDGHDAGVPSSIATVGARTVIAFSRWSDRRLVVAVDEADLRFTERTLPTRSPAPYPRIATSQGSVFVADGDCSPRSTVVATWRPAR